MDQKVNEKKPLVFSFSRDNQPYRQLFDDDCLSQSKIDMPEILQEAEEFYNQFNRIYEMQQQKPCSQQQMALHADTEESLKAKQMYYKLPNRLELQKQLFHETVIQLSKNKSLCIPSQKEVLQCPSKFMKTHSITFLKLRKLQKRLLYSLLLNKNHLQEIQPAIRELPQEFKIQNNMCSQLGGFYKEEQQKISQYFPGEYDEISQKAIPKKYREVKLKIKKSKK